MRWPFGPPHLTLKPSPENQKDKKNKKKQKKKNKTKKKKSKMSFSIISQFFHIFWWVSKNSLFWQLGPDSAHPQNTIKIGVSAHQFLKNSYASQNGHFWTKKQIHKFQLSFFLPFASLSTTKNTTICWNPYFYSVLANLKKRIFKNST